MRDKGTKMFIRREYLNDNETSQGLRRLREISSLPYADKIAMTEGLLEKALEIWRLGRKLKGRGM